MKNLKKKNTSRDRSDCRIFFSLEIFLVTRFPRISTGGCSSFLFPPDFSGNARCNLVDEFRETRSRNGGEIRLRIEVESGRVQFAGATSCGEKSIVPAVVEGGTTLHARENRARLAARSRIKLPSRRPTPTR